MASGSAATGWCPVCRDVCKDPVVLLCSHSFCKVCLHGCQTGAVVRECPVCKKRVTQQTSPRNEKYKKAWQSFLQQRHHVDSEPLCSLHLEKLTHFCVDLQQPLCHMCLSADGHKDHRHTLMTEAAEALKEELQDALKPLKEKIKSLNKVKRELSRTETYLEFQVLYIRRTMKELFKKLHQFLQEEEESRIRAVMLEEAQKSQDMKKMMEEASAEVTCLTQTLEHAETQLGLVNVPYLRTHDAALERIQEYPLPDDPHMSFGALMDQAKHLGNLRFNIWNNMRDIISYRPVLLDPNSAGPNITVSEDLTEVKRVKQERLPGFRKRNQPYMVQACEGWSSGSHSWEVDIADNIKWMLGVKTQSDPVQKNKYEWWELMSSNGKYYIIPPSSGQHTPLAVNKVLKRIGLTLDVDAGTLSFYDAETNTDFYTMTQSFTGKTLFPYIYTDEPNPLTILPMEVCVVVKKSK